MGRVILECGLQPLFPGQFIQFGPEFLKAGGPFKITARSIHENQGLYQIRVIKHELQRHEPSHGMTDQAALFDTQVFDQGIDVFAEDLDGIVFLLFWGFGLSVSPMIPPYGHIISGSRISLVPPVFPASGISMEKDNGLPSSLLFIIQINIISFNDRHESHPWRY